MNSPIGGCDNVKKKDKHTGKTLREMIFNEAWSGREKKEHSITMTPTSAFHVCFRDSPLYTYILSGSKLTLDIRDDIFSGAKAMAHR